MVATVDRAQATLITDQIGRTQGMTPDGFLLCGDVRIARTGDMLYAPQELPSLDPGSNRMLVVMRDADVLFDGDAILSFAGKDITLQHPDDMISPATWAGSSVGVVLNPRRGEGLDHNYLVADLLVKRPDAIEAVRSGLREVSCGYDCEYEQVKPGVGRQVRIIGNHVALVDRGRCGPSCAIGDEMPKKGSLLDRLMGAFKAKDEEGFKKEVEKLEDEMEEGDEKSVVVHVHNNGAKEDSPDDPMMEVKDSLKGISDGQKAIKDQLKLMDERLCEVEKTKDAKAKAKDEEGDEDKKDDDDKKEEDKKEEGSKDSAAFASEWQDTVSRAEMLMPGLRIANTFDAKAPASKTVDSLCAFRRLALDKAKGDPKRGVFVSRAFGGKPPAMATVDCDAVKFAFLSASEFAKDANNAARSAVNEENINGPMTPARLQKINQTARSARKS